MSNTEVEPGEKFVLLPNPAGDWAQYPVPFGYEDSPADIQWMAAVVALKSDQDPSAVYERMNAQLEEATTEDEILGGSEVLNMKRDAEALAGIPFQLVGLDFQASDFRNSDEGLPCYAVMQIRFADGNISVITAGSRTVINQCKMLWMRKLIPTESWMTFKQSRTSAGYDVFRLVKAAL